MPSNRLLFVAVIGWVLVATACGGNASTPFEPAAQPVFSAGDGDDSDRRAAEEDGGWGENRLSSCQPLDADSESEDIGPSGGELEIGPHRLVVPAGALLRRTRITGKISPDSVNSVQFSPEGLRFLVPARLHLSYENCKRVNLKRMNVVYTSDNLLQLLELIPSEDEEVEETVVGLVSHFSRYAVAY